MANKLFRQQALDTLESPEQLTDHIRVTGPSFYLWMASLLICVVAACVWALNSTISDFVKINGIAFPHQKITPVTAPLDGRITEVFVKKGQAVKPGDILFRYTTGGAVRELRSTSQGVVLSHKVQQETFNAPGNPGEIYWSHPNVEKINIKIGTFCSLQIVTRHRPVYDLLFN